MGKPEVFDSLISAATSFRMAIGSWTRVIPTYGTKLWQCFEESSRPGALNFRIPCRSVLIAPTVFRRSMTNWSFRQATLLPSYGAALIPDTPSVQVARLHRRFGGAWHTISATASPLSPTATPKDWPPVGFADYTWYNALINSRGLDKLELYFPAVQVGSADLADMPTPNTAGFWSLYAETVTELIITAGTFEKAVSTLSKQLRKGQNVEEIRQSIWFLDSLAQTVIPTSEVDAGGRLIQVRRSPGLLASYALMILTDLEDGRKIIDCEHCGDLFVSNELRAAYCSKKCRDRARSRRSYHRTDDVSLKPSKIATKKGKAK
jgi:hypothetical protein